MENPNIIKKYSQYPLKKNGNYKKIPIAEI
jgi:hypothetical protein